MKNKFLIMSFFALSLLIGLNIGDKSGVGELRASPAPLILYPSNCDNRREIPKQQIEIIHNLNSGETKVIGADEANVNLTIVGNIRRRIITKTERDTVKIGYPRVDLDKKLDKLALPDLKKTILE